MRQGLIRLIRRNPALLERLRIARTDLLGRLPGADRRPEAPAHLADWSQARPGIAVPPDLVFADIPVVPARRFVYRDLISDGGPVWPDFEATPSLRHQVHDRPVDRNALPGRLLGPRLEGPAIWGGRCFHHFGHLAAEHLNRLPGALYHAPRAPVLFTLQPGKLIRDVPGYVWDMAAWFGLSPDRIRFVTRPLVAGSLHVSPQTEHMSALPPPGWYLDLLDELARLNRLVPVPHPALYVHRVGQLAQGNGACAGEAALVAALQRAGVAVVDPGRESVARQMALYAGARVLIFAEGSAVHGRQLLGRVDQTILVLQRRPGSTMAHAQLAPRCRALDHAPVIGAFACPRSGAGGDMPVHGIAFYDLPALFGVFRAQGIDLEGHWDQADYRRCVRQDARDWARVILARPDLDRAATRGAVAAAFDQAGLSDASAGA